MPYWIFLKLKIVIVLVFYTFELHCEKVYRIVPKYEHSAFDPVIVDMNMYPYIVCAKTLR